MSRCANLDKNFETLPLSAPFLVTESVSLLQLKRKSAQKLNEVNHEHQLVIIVYYVSFKLN